jgi:DNA repair protein RadC
MDGRLLAPLALVGAAVVGTLRRGSSVKVSREASEVIAMELSKVSDETLLAVVLRGTTGKRPPIDVARDLLRQVDGDLFRLGEVPSLLIAGFSEEGRIRVSASAEIVRRSLHRSLVRQSVPITKVQQFVDYILSLVIGPEESLVAVYVDRRMRPIGARVLTKGSSGYTVVDPRQVYRVALQLDAHGVLLAHNHPSGDATPSPQDLEVTKRVSAAGRQLGIELVDHVVIVPGAHVSLRERGYLSAGYGESYSS